MEHDKDLVRERMRLAVRQVLEAELTEAVGASQRERSGQRKGYRAGYDERGRVTRVGRLEIARQPTDPPAQQRRDRAAARNAWKPSPERAAAASAADDALSKARAKTTAAQQRTQEAQARRAAAEDLRPAQQVACLQAQRARLGTPAERTEGRIPGRNGT